jgi:uncharacterized protein YjiS (DUF1127 family)
MSQELISVPRNCTDTSGQRSIDLRSAPSPLAPWARRMARIPRHLGEWRERARSRRLLLQLDDRMLRDVGLSRADVARECDKYFWQR